MKRFKGKKRKKNKILKYIFLFFFFFAYIFILNYLKKNRLEDNLLNKDINYINFSLADDIEYKINNNLKNPVNLLNSNVKKVYKLQSKVTYPLAKKVSSTKQEKVYNPILYIYNTHQTEKYADYDVVSASKYLQSLLNNAKLDSYYEEQSIPVFLQNNNLKYYKSYTASRKYLSDTKLKYPSINYYFDIHRDSAKKDRTTLVYNKKSYAKILFIVGLENANYNSNLNNATRLNNIIDKKVNGISRGIYKKQGEGVDGVYNQDISENVFLIEIGGVDNTSEEVKNTLDIIYKSIYEYINGVL